MARVAVRPLVGTRVTPNQITTLRLAVGLAAAGALASGVPVWQDVGAGIFVLATILDRADGELARMGGKTSAWGHTYDLVADAVCDTMILVGLGVGLRESMLGLWAVPMGVIAGISVSTIFWLVMRVETVAGERAAELGSLAGFDADDAVLVIPVAVWLEGSAQLLVVAAVAAPTVLVFFFWFSRRRLRALRSDAPEA